MKAEQLAVVQGWDETRADAQALEPRTRGRVLRPWALGSLAVTVLLLAATWLVATPHHRATRAGTAIPA